MLTILYMQLRLLSCLVHVSLVYLKFQLTK